jgi:hypothetical protein
MIFKVIHPGRNTRTQPNSNDIQSAVNTFYKLVNNAKKSPGVSQSRSQSRSQTPTSRGKYDIQGYYKKINDMMMDDVDLPLSPKLPRKPSTNPSTPHNLFNLPLFSKSREGDDDLKNHFFHPFSKKEGLTLNMSAINMDSKINNFLSGSHLSPKMQRDTIIPSPLFSSTHQGGGFYRGFTPTNFAHNFPETARSGLYFDDFLFRPSPMTPTAGYEFNAKMDKIVDNLRTDIQNNVIPHPLSEGEPSSGQKSLGLNIDLINDTYVPAPPTKSSIGFNFSHIQPLTNKSSASFKRTGDLLQSPNSSFLSRKKF